MSPEKLDVCLAKRPPTGGAETCGPHVLGALGAALFDPPTALGRGCYYYPHDLGGENNGLLPVPQPLGTHAELGPAWVCACDTGTRHREGPGLFRQSRPGVRGARLQRMMPHTFLTGRHLRNGCRGCGRSF